MKFMKQFSDGMSSIGRGILSIGDGMTSLWKEPPTLEDYKSAGKIAVDGFAEDTAKMRADWEAVGNHLSAATGEIRGGFSRATTHLDAAGKEAIARATKRT
jgi:hypothetical protein